MGDIWRHATRAAASRAHCAALPRCRNNTLSRASPAPGAPAGRFARPCKPAPAMPFFCRVRAPPALGCLPRLGGAGNRQARHTRHMALLRRAWHGCRGRGRHGPSWGGAQAWPPLRGPHPLRPPCPPPAGRGTRARAFCAPGRFLGTGAMACGAPCAKDRLYLAAWNGRDAGIWILRASRREKSTWHPCGPQQTILISHRPRRPRVNVAGHPQPLAAAVSAVAPAPFTGHCGTPVPHTARDHGAPSAARGPREPPAAGRAGGE